MFTNVTCKYSGAAQRCRQKDQGAKMMRTQLLSYPLLWDSDLRSLSNQMR